jgi:hypothetical protein
MTVYNTTASAFTSSVFSTFIDAITTQPFVTVNGIPNIPDSTYYDVVRGVNWHIQGVNTQTNTVGNIFTSTTVTVFIQTFTNAGLQSYVINPDNGAVLFNDNVNRTGLGFSLGSSDATTATALNLLSWIQGRNPYDYLQVISYMTTTISTTILESSQEKAFQTFQPQIKVPAFNTVTTFSTSTF